MSLPGAGRLRSSMGGRKRSLQLTVTTQPVLWAVDQVVVLDVHMCAPLCNHLHGDNQIVEVADASNNLDWSHGAAGIGRIGSQHKLQGVVEAAKGAGAASISCVDGQLCAPESQVVGLSKSF